MSKKLKYSLLLFLVASVIFSCVPMRKFEDLKKQKDDCYTERDDLRFKYKEYETEKTELAGQIEELTKNTAQLKKDTATLGLVLRRLQSQYDKILELNDQLLEKQKELVAGNQNQTEKILKEYQKTLEDLQKQEDELRELERTLDKKRLDLVDLQSELEKKNSVIDAKNKDLEARTKELTALQNKLNSMDSLVNALKDKVSKALVGFEGNGLTIEQKNGKVYVSLENKLLFKSGSFAVDAKGKEAIKNLAGVLEKNEDVAIMIEGHTDTDAYNGSGQIKDNWDLSVMRATAIVKILLDGGSTIDPKRITAAGRGEFVPIDSADTPEAKAKNRRTEIVLTPKLDELFKIIGSN